MDMILTGGTVLTMDPQVRRAEAVAVRDGKIAAVGFATEIAAMAREHDCKLGLGRFQLIEMFDCDLPEPA